MFENVPAKQRRVDAVFSKALLTSRLRKFFPLGTFSTHGLGPFTWVPTRHREALFNQHGVNAGGGQASNFTADLGTDQGAALIKPKAKRKRRTNHGGCYDTNAFIDLYPAMSRAYARDQLPPRLNPPHLHGG